MQMTFLLRNKIRKKKKKYFSSNAACQHEFPLKVLIILTLQLAIEWESLEGK